MQSPDIKDFERAQHLVYSNRFGKTDKMAQLRYNMESYTSVTKSEN